MHWWVHGPIWASLLVKCLIGFLFLWHVNCYKFQQAAERFENHEEISRLRCKTIQQCHKELVQTIEGPWVHFQPLTNTTCFYYLTLAHYEMEFSRMTLHVPLAKAVNLTDNTLEVTWTWAWAHSFQSLILCGKFSASFTFVQTYPRENLLLSFQLVRMEVAEWVVKFNVSWNVFLTGLLFAKMHCQQLGIEHKYIHCKKPKRPTVNAVISQRAMFLVGIFLTCWQFCVFLEQVQDRRANALCSLFLYWANPAEMQENSDLTW